MSAARNSKRSRRNRGRFSFLFKLLAIVAIGAALTVGATVFFKVEQVVVEGNQRYTAQEVDNASGIQIGDNLFRLNKYQIKSDILQTLPYVEGVNIVRRLPSTIAITVHEWDAVARIAYTPLPESAVTEQTAEGEETVQMETAKENEMWLISVGGKLLEVSPEDSQAILVSGLTALAPKAGTMLAVPQEQQDKLNGLLALLGALEERGTISFVTEIDLTAAAQVRMRYDNRFWVKMPVNGDFTYFLRALEAVVEQRGPGEKGTMDLTREDYVVVYSPE
jgi:cell division protein FtsQ